MTGYHISIGYISGHSCSHNRKTAWEKLKEIVSAVRKDHIAIQEEAYTFNAPVRDAGGDLLTYCKRYSEKYKDKLLTIYEEGESANGEPQIMILASGDRCLKEHVARAFCRLVIKRMHSMGIEVNLHVV